MTAQDSLAGRILSDRYEIKDRIGIGGMAEVYRAQDKVLGRVVAVKVMLPQYASDPDFTQRFRQEAAAAANLQSPYIVNVYDWGHEGGTYYIVMEFVRGSDLKTAIQQRGAINQRKVAEIGAQVCQALTVAHKQDIIHRDIKPQNIMVQPDGNVKVMDFGIARAKNSVKQKTSAVLGTAHYISPEQAQGKELTAASDIYSLGVVMYEATTGKLPFDGPDAVNVALQQVKETPVPPREINPDIDPALESIIMCAMAKSPSDRFATANDMRLALNDYLAGRPVNLGSGNSFTSAQTRVIGAAAMSGQPDSTQLMPGVNRNMPISTQPNEFKAEPPKKSRKGLVVGIVIAVVAVAAAIIVALTLLGGNGGGKTVPSVVDMPVETATSTLEAEGFTVGTVNSTFSTTVAEGRVISQDPAGNTRQPEGTRVNLLVSQGQEQVTVPNFINMTRDQAQSEANKAGITLTAAPAQYSSDVARDKIMSQNPAAGTSVAKGSTVEYVLSLGPEPVEVPDVEGFSRSDAISVLEQAGFTVKVTRQFSNNWEYDTVISQNPASGMAERGSEVTINVSNGPMSTSSSSSSSSGGGNGGDNEYGNTGSSGSGSSSSSSASGSSSGSGGSSGTGSGSHSSSASTSTSYDEE